MDDYSSASQLNSYSFTAFYRFFIWGVLSFFLLATTSLIAQRNCLDNLQFYNPTRQAQLEIFTKKFLKNPQSFSHHRKKITIPVVVHIVKNWQEEDTISDTQIHSQIEALNRDFNLKNVNLAIVPSDFKNNIGKVGFNFCLATQTPDGQPTTGITRRQTSTDLVATSKNNWVYSTDQGGQDSWDTEHYLNIWVTQMAANIAGYGSKPGERPPQEDGVILSPHFFGMGGTATPPFHLGRTGVHEVGHYFNLFHPWTGGCSGTDFVADTPQQANPYNGCPSGKNESCSTKDITANYMNYTSDDCLAMFTKGQALRMQAALLGARYSLLNSNGCEPVATVSNATIAVYPNPASFYFCIETGRIATSKIPFKLYDYRGVTIMEGTLSPNEAQHFPTLENGVYFLAFFKKKENRIVQKIVVRQ